MWKRAKKGNNAFQTTTTVNNARNGERKSIQIKGRLTEGNSMFISRSLRHVGLFTFRFFIVSRAFAFIFSHRIRFNNLCDDFRNRMRKMEILVIFIFFYRLSTHNMLHKRVGRLHVIVKCGGVNDVNYLIYDRRSL